MWKPVHRFALHEGTSVMKELIVYESFFAKIISMFYLLTLFTKTFHARCSQLALPLQLLCRYKCLVLTSASPNKNNE